MNNSISVAIIGSASSKNKKEYKKSLNKQTWEIMCQDAENYIISNISDDWSNIDLVSGGAAWADHIAVYLFLKHPESKLSLHFPCQWDAKNVCFYDNGHSHWAVNPGKLANIHHKAFQQSLSDNTLEQVQTAINKGATIYDHYKGFHCRNIAVGKAQYIIAFTFSNSDQPLFGGTAHTWKNSKSNNKKHFTIK